MNQREFSLSRAYAEALLTHGPVGLALFDAHTFCLLAMNPVYATLLDTFLDPHWKHGHAIGHPFTAWLPGADDTGITAIFQNVVRTGIAFRNGEFAFPAFEQGMTYWDWSLDPVYDEAGHIAQLHQTAHNITPQILVNQQTQQTNTLLFAANRNTEEKRKRLEVVETVARSVRESLNIERVGSATVEAIKNYFPTLRVAIHIADPARQVLRLLHAYTAPGNESIFSLLQRVPYDSNLLIAQARHHYGPLVVEDEQISLIAGILESDANIVSEYVHGYVCVPLWFHEHFEGTLSAVFDTPIIANGMEVQMLADCGTHIAASLAHARMHSDVVHERIRLHQVLDQLPEGILLVEAPNTQISYVNEAAASIYGFPISTLIGKTISWLGQNISVADTGGQPIPSSEYGITRALQGETVSQRESAFTRSDGSTIVALSSTVPLRTTDGIITGAVAVFQDITERKTIEQQKSDFLSIASHELRTPITSIQAYAEIFQQLLAGGENLNLPRMMRATTMMINQCQHLTRLIQELLELSHIETMHFVLRMKPYDLIAALHRLIEDQELITKNHQLRLVFDGPQPTDTLIGLFDGDHMEQIFNNLLSNAVKYSPAGSEIEVGLRYQPETPGEVLIWVKDHGIGIAASDIPHIFDRFRRARTLDQSISGFGIGLYLVQEFVTRQGGRVWAESIEGSGSTFWMLLPFQQALS